MNDLKQASFRSARRCAKLEVPLSSERHPALALRRTARSRCRRRSRPDRRPLALLRCQRYGRAEIGDLVLPADFFGWCRPTRTYPLRRASLELLHLSSPQFISVPSSRTGKTDGAPRLVWGGLLGRRLVRQRLADRRRFASTRSIDVDRIELPRPTRARRADVMSLPTERAASSTAAPSEVARRLHRLDHEHRRTDTKKMYSFVRENSFCRACSRAD